MTAAFKISRGSRIATNILQFQQSCPIRTKQYLQYTSIVTLENYILDYNILLTPLSFLQFDTELYFCQSKAFCRFLYKKYKTQCIRFQFVLSFSLAEFFSCDLCLQFHFIGCGRDVGLNSKLLTYYTQRIIFAASLKTLFVAAENASSSQLIHKGQAL